MTTSHSPPGARREPGSGRSRDAGASKEALLEAAQELFGQKGFERTTVREIGEHAGVDAALIARYFGSKADLYIAAVAAERLDDRRPQELDRLEQIVEAMVVRSDRTGPGPIVQALVRSDTSDEIRTAAQGHLMRRWIEPLTAAMARQGIDRPRLRAEIAASALIGVNLGRSVGWFEGLRSVPQGELIELLTEAIGGVAGSPNGTTT